MREAIGRYQLRGQLGEGGMGLVYEAWDDRLGRSIALKVMRPALQDVAVRDRFWREARAAGALSHPNICHVYEIGEDEGELFIAMERLDGESLAERLGRGPLAPAEAIQVALGVLAGLEAVHARGLLHRDLKPSNVFLTPHGIKLLDFGLALAVSTTPSDHDHTRPALTLPGVVMGTPAYMAPEQILAQGADARADLYAVGAMLFEMLAGRPPFQASTPAEILARVLSERPPALGGPPLVIAADRVVHRALARNRDERYADAAAMAQDLRSALRFVESGTQAPVRPIRRLIVLPFRLLRSDPDIEFLAFGLADAITASLAGTAGLVVRSSLAAARYAGSVPELAALAAETDVDLVVSGTLLRAGDRIRVVAQLVEAPGGTVLWSHTLQASLTDLFQVQDDLARHVVESVNASLGTRRRPQRAPRGRAHELYLRGNQLAFEPGTWSEARTWYEQAVAEDPDYAPAWARLGRIYRILAKYAPDADVSYFDRADEALRRALELDPDLSMAVTYRAQFDVEFGRAREALVRLVERTSRHPSDPHLMAGIVHASRYGGLVEVSAAAHDHVRRLDPLMPTSAVNTFWLKGDYARALDETRLSSDMMTGVILSALGRDAEAIESFAHDEQRFAGSGEADFAGVMRLVLLGRGDEARPTVERYLGLPTFVDPEGLFHVARILARLGDVDRALHTLARTIDGGYCGLPALLTDRWLDSLRGRSEFRALLDRAAADRRAALDAFVVAGGERVLGVMAG
jgi:eukaryotic-like serine/threonine-protein kinase